MPELDLVNAIAEVERTEKIDKCKAIIQKHLNKFSEEEKMLFCMDVIIDQIRALLEKLPLKYQQQALAITLDTEMAKWPKQESKDVKNRTNS